MQDENKKLDDTEKKARLIVNERLDSLLYDIQDVMAAKGNPRNEKVDTDLDEAYAFPPPKWSSRGSSNY